jgi:hypothetical protein
MRTALAQPHPYLLNRAGGICAVKEFSLVQGELHVVPEAEKPLVGIYHLIYRCDDHALSDIKRSVSSDDGEHWSVADTLSPDEDCDVCYPGPCAEPDATVTHATSST